MKSAALKYFLVTGLFIALISAIYAAGSFNWPLNLDKSLTATQGEIRGSRLHQGIDIKTNGRNYPVFSPAPARLSRIISKPEGYGNAIFLDHGNNIQTVYGHLDRFEEGRHNLASLADTLKTLYNNDRLDFRFYSDSYYCERDEKIAFTGESGSGLPHLHFEIRNSDISLNPLDYVHVADRNPPAIQSIYICTEKDNGTVSEKKYTADKSWGTYSISGPEAPAQGSRIFFKLSCYDMIGAANRVAIYRAKVFENGREIFETAFDALNPADIDKGPYVYDTSKSTIKEGATYVYFLCRRSGNSFSGIKTDSGGYVIPDSSEKNIRIEIFDLSGNQAVLKFKLPPGTPEPEKKDEYVSIEKGKRYNLKNDEGNVCVKIFPESLTDSTIIKIEDLKTDDFNKILHKDINRKDVLKAFSVLPHDTVYAGQFGITFRPEGGLDKNKRKNMLIYKLIEGRKPFPLETVYNYGKNIIEAQTNTNGYFAVIIDTEAPEIFLPPTHEFCEDREIYRKMRFYISDNLSKINAASIECLINGENFPAEYDVDRKWIQIVLPRYTVAKGLHHVFIKTSDKAENQAVFRGLFIFD